MSTHRTSSQPTSDPGAPAPGRGPIRAGATRAAVVAATTATAALLAVLPGTGAPAPAAAPPAAPAAERVAAQPATTVASSRTVALVAAEAPAAAASGSALELALSRVGSPYRWGAAGPSAFDCSGLVSWAFESAGVDVPRTSRAQSQVGTAVSRDELQPGDLVFFYSPVSHVGIYVGDGQIVHASTSGRPVAVADMDRMPFHSARRL